ncbi:MAG: DUF2062 domain-containing protein [Bacteroidales bacterium]|nr:DUF2062 domain-containing protein [Bacteroidales bacterium]
MIRSLSPSVVGHFDLVRIHDPDYRRRMEAAPVKERIRRNLDLVRERNLILDCNARAFVKGAAEPYPTETILRQALELNIAVVPGDDSHGVDSVGLHAGPGLPAAGRPWLRYRLESSNTLGKMNRKMVTRYGSKLAQAYKKAYERFLRIRGTPQEIALGFALGLFVGMSPFLGFHMAIAVFLAALFEWNKISAAVGVWILQSLHHSFHLSPDLPSGGQGHGD